MPAINVEERLCSYCEIDSFVCIHPPQIDAFMLVVASQDKIAMDTVRGDKSLQQRRRKLDGFTCGATCYHVQGHTPVVIQIGLSRDVQRKFVAVHGGRETKLERGNFVA